MNKNTMTAAIFSLTLFISAALMFAVQPMVGKMLLPLVGGTPAGWVVAMAFFQTALLAGYFLAHILSRWPARQHTLLFIAVLGVGCFFLPVALPTQLGSGDTPNAWGIFGILSMAVGLPFVALSTASSTMQRLFTTTGHPSSSDPYFLYAASNLGSFGGLLLYPLLAEPFLGLSLQSSFWFICYALLIGLALLCLTRANKVKEEKQKVSAPKLVPLQQKLMWVALAFVPSSLLMGVTTHITTEVFSAPMIWVLPLAFYLMTFVIAFAKRPPVTPKLVSFLHPLAVCVVLGLVMINIPALRWGWSNVFVHLMAFGAVALACHMRLVAMRPADNRHLTVFYLMLSVGGALGGLLNAFIILIVFNSMIEYPVMMILSLLLHPEIREKIKTGPRVFLGFSLFLALIYIGCLLHFLPFINDTYAILLANISIITIFLLSSIHPRQALIMGALMMAAFCLVVPRENLVLTRNFYGVIKVYDRHTLFEGKDVVVRQVSHGTTVHGIQLLDPKEKTRPTSYYTPGSGIGSVFSLYKPKDVVVIGLGAGVVNCHNAPDRAFTFIDIDPGMAKAAKEQFTFLKDCKGRERPKVIIGDGRLEIEKMRKSRKFDLIVLDAFTSDAVPMHLLTVEAIESYLKHLKPGGIMLFHVSNRYFDLASVLAANAKALNLPGALKMHRSSNDSGSYVNSSLWFAMAREESDMARVKKDGWEFISADPGRRPWTDDYTNLLGALNKRK